MKALCFVWSVAHKWSWGRWCRIDWNWLRYKCCYTTCHCYNHIYLFLSTLKPLMPVVHQSCIWIRFWVDRSQCISIMKSSWLLQLRLKIAVNCKNQTVHTCTLLPNCTFYMFNSLVPELNSWYNLQNPGFKIQDFIFSCILLHTHPHTRARARTHTQKGGRKIQMEHPPAGLYKNDSNWLMHVLCC